MMTKRMLLRYDLILKFWNVSMQHRLSSRVDHFTPRIRSTQQTSFCSEKVHQNQRLLCEMHSHRVSNFISNHGDYKQIHPKINERTYHQIQIKHVIRTGISRVAHLFSFAIQEFKIYLATKKNYKYSA